VVIRERSFGDRVTDIVIYLLVATISIACAVPVVYVFVSSFAARSTEVIPTKFTMDAYAYVFSTRVFVRSLGISVYITLMGTFVSLLVTSLMAYALADRQLWGRGPLLFLVVFTMLFSGGIIPTYIVVKATGLLDSLWALMIPSAISAFNLIVLKNFFQSIPEELKEAARIDGCHEMWILFRVIIPLSLPAMAAFGLFYAVAKWNLFFDAILYVSNPIKWPVQVVVRQVVFMFTGVLGEMSDKSVFDFSGETIKSAVIVVSTIPIMLVYPFLQKHFAKGLLLGSVKG
jgi:putative aldouronate transport system permease protein